MSYTVKEMPESDRPREKLLSLGERYLTDTELLAIIIRTGLRGKNVIELSREVLLEFGGLSGLINAHVRELSSFKGLGKTKAATIKAALEIGKRAYSFSKPSALIQSPEDVFNLVGELKYEKVEIFGVITLDSKSNLIAVRKVSKGGVNFASLSPKEVFHPAVKDLASAVVLFHNHPSGDPTPSSDDIEVTDRLIRAGRLLSIDVLDHVIVASKGFFSMKREGII